MKVEVYDFVKDAALARELGISPHPGHRRLAGKRIIGIRFYGIPSGYEFASLVEAVRLVANG